MRICRRKSSIPNDGPRRNKPNALRLAIALRGAHTHDFAMLSPESGRLRCKVRLCRRESLIVAAGLGETKPIALRLVCQAARAVKIPVVGLGGIAT